MNLSNTVTRIKIKLGLMAISTPFKDLDGTITEIIQNITVPVFSTYNPVKEVIHTLMSDLELLEHTDSYEKYLLPEFKNRNLINVLDVQYDTSILAGLGYYGGGLPLMEGNLLDQAMLSNAGANLMNTLIPKLTFHYEHPRTLYVFNAYSSSKIIIELAFEHDKTLASIPETARESFMQLALLDVKENLYPTLKQYTELNTAIGNINLKLDDWANAEQDRAQLIDKWDDVYHLDLKPVYYA